MASSTAVSVKLPPGMGAQSDAATSSSAAPQSKRPKDSDFYQQRLKAWQPILTPTWVIITFLVIGIPFVAIGFALKAVDDKVVEYVQQYDGANAVPGYENCHVPADGSPAPGACSVAFSVDKDMAAPVFVYYQLENFYQNHRRYVKSRSDSQLSGTVYTDKAGVSECDPLFFAPNSTKLLDPCGLIANSYFTDTFALQSGSQNLNMSESNIAWPSDREKKFKDPDPAALNAAIAAGQVQYINQTYPGVNSITNEHFIVWMRVAAVPNFRKLYGRIEQDIPAGTTLTFNVASTYNVAKFQGSKSLVISTTSFMGGKNPFLGIAYIVVGFVCILLALLFGVRQLFGGRRLGDTAFLVWNSRK